ncbi:putative ribonuclease H-like domain-containing protein [Tanacetum coccineum]|uniref:Ribonuclease H-like domain-containing protein n=1 Tax=Tanacetum coccineum TaxID=301880 RepID=A0ABQ4ZFI2_9ASTR
MAEQDTPPPTITAMKIPIIKKGEYDIWSMRMRKYICHTDHTLWDIIVNGDIQEETAPESSSGDQTSPPAYKTAKQLAAKRNQERERVKSILLLAIPDEYLLKFHNVPDAKSFWEAIKSRFGGNDESKKMQRNIDIDDLYNNLRVYEDKMKRSSSSTSNALNLAFLSSKNTSSTYELSTASGNFGVSTAGGTNSSSQVSSTTCADEVMCSFFAQQTTSPQLENEDLQQIDEDDLEELDQRWQVAMLTIRVKKFIQKTGRNLYLKGKQPVGFDKSKVECYNCHRTGHFARECKSGRNQGKRSYGDNGRRNASTNEPSSQALVAQDGLGGYDWSNDFDEPVNYALMAISSLSSSSSSNNQDYELALESLESRILGHENNELAWGEKYEFQNYDLNQMSANDKSGLGYVTQLDEVSNKSETDSEISISVFGVRSIDEEITPANDRFSKVDEYHAVPPPITGNLLNPRANMSFACLDEYAIRKKIIESKTTEPKTTTSESKTYETVGETNKVNVEKPKSVYESLVSKLKINRDKVIIEDWNSDDEDVVSEVSPVKTNETHTVKTQVDKISQMSKKEGIGFKKVKACFVCKSTGHLIKDCNFYGKKSPEPKLKNVVNSGQKMLKGAVRPIYPRIDNVRPKASYLPIKRSYYTKPAFRPKDLKQDVKISGVKNITTARTRTIVSTGNGKMDNVPKKSMWVWRPKVNYMDHESKESGSFMLKKFEYVDPKGISKSVMTWVPKRYRFLLLFMQSNPEAFLQDHTVVDSRCSSHMTSNKAYLSDYEDYNGGFVAFGSDPKGGKITGKGKIKTANLDFDNVYFVGELKFNIFSVSQMCDKKNSVLFTDTECLILSPSFKLLDESQVVLRAPRQNDVYSLDLKNIVPSGSITCLYKNATTNESKLWHRRLGHVNFKNINKLVKGHLVRGIPSKVFVNDHTCVACKKGKQHKASCKAKSERTTRKPLELLHMDLFGPVSVESINKKRYCLVVTDDFSRFSWVFFLATKDETNEILYNFITGLENQLNHKVKIIRCDHETEFKNHAMNEFCAKKGIKREFSVARTSPQNSVAERKNRTLIEAARTMLADSLLPIPFWAEAVNTACYVLNRVLVTKPQNKTPYELLIGKPPSISFMRPFEYPLTILNTLDPLDKFDGKSDKGYLLGYYYALTTHPTIYVLLIEQFWQTATVKIVNTGEQKIIATVDGHKFTITEASVRRHLQLADADGISSMPNTEPKTTTISIHVIKPPIPQSTSFMPHDSPLSGGNIPGSVEGSLKLNELIAMCTKLVEIVTTLDTELNQTKQVYGNTIAKLVKKVKHLENKLKTSKGRIKETEVEDISFKDDISLLSAAKILTEASTEKIKTCKKRKRSTDNTKISTDEGTAKGIFGTAKDIQGTDEEIARKIQEEEQAKDLDCQEQERINLEAAQELQRQFDQERQDIDYIDWKTIIEQVQEKQSGSMIRYQALKKKPVTVAQATKNMKIYLKNMAGYRMTNFKGTTYDQIRPIFEKEYNKESFKKLRTTQASSSEPIQEYSTTEPKELSQEELKKMMQIVPVEEVKVEVLQVKYPIIYWEIHSEGSKKYWKIIRVSNITESFQRFEDMLKVFDREDLDTLWSLVKERITLAEPADDIEKASWVQLKRIYEPDKDDTRWKLQRYMHDPLIWRLYGSCAVHHVSSTRGQDIFMLIEKDYPLLKLWD